MQTVESEQKVPSATGGWVHDPPLHTSAVQRLPSSPHGFGLFGCVHAPALHTSLVQTFPSSPHAVPLPTGVFWHPVAGLHESVVQSLESPQFTGVC